MPNEERTALLDRTDSNRGYRATDEQSREMTVAKDDPLKVKENKYNQASVSVGEETCNLYAYQETSGRKFFFYFLTIITLGLYRLFAYWMKNLEVGIRFVPSNHGSAEYLVVEDGHGIQTIKKVFEKSNPSGFPRPTRSGKVEKVNQMRFFTYRKTKYIWYEREEEWINPADLDSTAPFILVKNTGNENSGLTEEEVVSKRELYNKNELFMNLTPILVILFKEVLGPFYLFQAFSVILWYVDSYMYYATVIIIITCGSAISSVREMRKQEKRVLKMVGEKTTVTLRRDGKDIVVDASEMVPGDIMVLPPAHFDLPCDCLLLNGSVIVNESMLTGESLPVTKASLKEAEDCSIDVRLSSQHNRHTLFSGTKIMQTRNYRGQPVLARVLRTGFSTLKGQLVRSIMYPKPQDPQQLKDVVMFVLVLGLIAMCGFAYTIAMMLYRQESAKHIVIRSLDIITIVVPPALPAAIAVGTIMAQRRLKKKEIFCISPTTINICGSVNACAFDKTGTLTQDGLDFNCVRAVRRNHANEPVFTMEFKDLDPEKMAVEDANLNIVVAAASCHSLTRIDGKVEGDPLELILVEKSKWVMEEPVKSDEETLDFDNVQPTVIRPPSEQKSFHPDNNEYSIIKQHPFNSALQRMSVIVSTPSEHSAHEMLVFSKGSPEMIASLCRPESIPDDYWVVVDHYSQKGFRLIAMAYKGVHMNFAKALKTPRDQMESELEFLGLIVMENRLKKETLPTINQLVMAKIRTIMVTGDNLLTAMSVARECGIIRPTKKAYLISHSKDEKDHRGRTKLTIKESVSSSESEIDTSSDVREFDRNMDMQKATYHLAIAGPTYEVINNEYPELVDRLAAVCDVYARMAPDQKAQMIESLQKIGLKTMMCGDGANDCSALKAAHAGISLSDNEASIAAPFTSKTPDITCVPKLIMEGRCALVSTYAVTKYMAAYSLNEFLTVMLLYWEGTNISDGQFLYIDLVLITVIALSMGRTPAAEKLHEKLPPNRLATPAFYFSVFGQLFLNIVFQVAGFLLTRGASWYVPNKEALDNTQTMIGTAMFYASCSLYLGYAFVYSKGHPYRSPVYTNWILCLSIFAIGAMNIVFIFTNIPFFIMLMNFVEIPSWTFRAILLIISLAGVLISIIYEQWIVEGLLSGLFDKLMLKRRIAEDDETLPLHERILAANGSSPIWFENEIGQKSNGNGHHVERKETIESQL